MEKDNISKKIVEFDDKSLLIVDDDNQLRELSLPLNSSGYGEYLRELLENKEYN